jgi:hypothetical protein
MDKRCVLFLCVSMYKRCVLFLCVSMDKHCALFLCVSMDKRCVLFLCVSQSLLVSHEPLLHKYSVSYYVTGAACNEYLCCKCYLHDNAHS